jgi:Asp-tRNA(Asn)/Glu-tRNA(Gln) amidotransferase A subunit family amidase
MHGHDAAFGAFVAFAPPASGRARGPLSGMRVAVKDNIAVRGLPYTAGVPRFASRRAESDAAVVTRLRDAGAAIVGVTRTDAGGLGVVTPEVVNPRDAGAIAGGSSGGSAAAVAGGLATAALGTDTGGSVRIPAACCGLFAFKPTHGRLPAEGVWPLASELEDVGVIAASFATLLQVSLALLGEAPVPASGAPVIGVDHTRLAGCEPAVRDAFESTLARLSRAGCTLRELRLPERDEVGSAHARLVLAAAMEVYAQPWRERDEPGLGPTIWRSLQAAEGCAPGEIDAAHGLRADVKSAWNVLLRDVDCVALPTLPVAVPRRGVKRIELGGQPLPSATVLTAETSLANFVGAPVAAIPAGGEFSVQLLGRTGEDAVLLARAAVISGMLEGN